MISVNFMAFVGLSRAGPPEASDFPWRSYGVDMGSEKLMGVLILGNSREREREIERERETDLGRLWWLHQEMMVSSQLCVVMVVYGDFSRLVYGRLLPPMGFFVQKYGVCECPIGIESFWG